MLGLVYCGSGSWTVAHGVSARNILFSASTWRTRPWFIVALDWSHSMWVVEMDVGMLGLMLVWFGWWRHRGHWGDFSRIIPVGLVLPDYLVSYVLSFAYCFLCFAKSMFGSLNSVPCMVFCIYNMIYLWARNFHPLFSHSLIFLYFRGYYLGWFLPSFSDVLIHIPIRFNMVKLALLGQKQRPEVLRLDPSW